MKFLNECDLEDHRQEGFCIPNSTTRYKTELIVVIQDALKTGTNPTGLLVDLEKAFESVWTNGCFSS